VNREDIRLLIRTALDDADDTETVDHIDESTFGLLLAGGQRVIVGFDIEIVDVEAAAR
jgi:hypothetical protein